MLDRNPDGTWQVRLNEVEMTVKEPHMAAMTRQLKPAVDALTDSNDLRVDDEPAAAPGLPLAQTSHATPTRLHKLADRATRMLQRIAPDMFRHGQVLHRGQDLLGDAEYIRQRGRDFTPEERAAILSDEGFYDPLARRSFVFAGQVRPQPGESPRAAVNRVFLHETVGHGGLAQLLATNEKALRNFKYLVEKIRKNVPEAYDAVANDPAYAHLEGDPVKIGIEIMGRETERRPELLQRPSVFRDMRLLVGHALAQLQIQLGLRAENAADIDRQVDMLLGRARRAADRDRQVSVANITGEGLLFSNKIYVILNETHKQSRPVPKGRGPNGGRLQSHHGLQQEWCLHNLTIFGYNPQLAPTITLETGIGFPHTFISRAQNSRRQKRLQLGQAKWGSSLQDELQYIVDDLSAAGLDKSVVQDVLNQQYAMLKKLKIAFIPITL